MKPLKRLQDKLERKIEKGKKVLTEQILPDVIQEGQPLAQAFYKQGGAVAAGGEAGGFDSAMESYYKTAKFPVAPETIVSFIKSQFPEDLRSEWFQEGYNAVLDEQDGEYTDEI